MCFKIKYPETFSLLRGNHECAGITRIYGVYDDCKRRYSVKVWKQFCDMLNCLLMSALIDEKILCVHGGLSPGINSLNDLRTFVRPTDVPDVGIICDLLWADPDQGITGFAERERSRCILHLRAGRGAEVFIEKRPGFGLSSAPSCRRWGGRCCDDESR
ncbi:unnamed protein product [Amoebophrya sp. A25]|nr:unnamed protein product [Amoebophrya sp. A25]|eukprot:GSA25T00019563001.1